MEFLDPKKQRAYLIRLFTGYVLVGVALILTTIILLYQAYGFGVNSNGEVFQNGLVYVSTRPRPADVYINGTKYKDTTNTRALMPAGQYTFRLQREGYRTWQRAINIEGGAVAHFDYPVLIPNKLVTKAVKSYENRPMVTTQSPDRHWLLNQTGSDFTTFELFDMTVPTKAPVGVIVPRGLFTLNEGTHSWKALEWSSDGRHVLLQHTTLKDGNQNSEYILIDRADIQTSLNLTTKLGLNPAQSQLTFRDKKYDKYYSYDKSTLTLTSLTLNDTKSQATLSHVLQYKTFGSNKILFATEQGASVGKVAIRLVDGNHTYTIRQVGVSPAYTLDLATYGNDWYVVVGGSNDNRTYIYKDPQAYLNDHPQSPLVPVQVLKVAGADHISFSENTRFVMVEHGQSIAVYDAENDKGYAYTLATPIDQPQAHVEWMDGHRLLYISGGKTVICDFDNTNHQTLDVADPAYAVLFDRDYKALYSFGVLSAKNADGTASKQFGLNSTSLLIPADQ